MPQQSQQQRSGRQFQRASREAMSGTQGRVSEGGNGVSEVIEQATKRLQDLSMETYRLAQDAIGLNMATMNRMVGCRSIGELAEIQRDYFKEAIDHTFDVSRRMYGKGSEMADEVSGAFPTSIHEAAEEAARKREDAKEANGGKR